MNKKILIFSFFVLLAVGGVIFKYSVNNNNNNETEKLRKQHADFLKNHPFQKTGELPKKERKAQGLPPNAYFEQKYLSEINPNTGRTHKEDVLKLQEKLNKRRAGQKAPGEIDNEWEERGPDNVGGRTRALLFDPNDTTNETVFAGGVSGGLWKNTKISDASNKWVRVGIPENLAVSCIVADPNDSKTFYIGTGESYVNGDANGNGLWKSSDGGNSWENIFGGATGDSFFDPNSKLTINSPTGLVGDYNALLTTAFGTSITAAITAEMVLINDGIEPNEDGCTDAVNESELTGNIAVIRRGACNFSLKAKIAQDAGAIAVIIVNNNDTAIFNMAAGDDGPNVTIPSLMISKKDGDVIMNTLTSGTVNATLPITKTDATNATLVSGIQHINDIIIRNNGGVSEIYVAAGESGYTGGVSLGGDSFGVYKSVDGINFSKLNIPKTAGNREHEPNDLEIASDNSIYLSTAQSSTFGDGGGIIFKSTDGNSFTKVHTVPDGVRTQIEVSPTNANTVYVLAETNTAGAPVKIFKTTDGFTTVSDLALPNDADTGISSEDFTRGQAFYDLLIKIDPNDENIVYVGGIDLFKTINGGTSWDQLSHWYGGFGFQEVHADQHGLAFASSSKMVFGNDGGVYLSDNSGTTISARNKNYNTLQFYTVGVAPTTAFGGDEYFLAGAQDNGTQLVGNAKAGINSSVEATGGDGAASFFDTDGSDKYYITNYVYNQSIFLGNLSNNSDITVNREDESNGDFINQEDLDSNLNILYSNYSNGTNYSIKRYSNLLGSIVKGNLLNSLMDGEPSALKVSPLTTASSKLYVGLKSGKLLKVEEANTNAATWSEITGVDFVGSISDIEFGANESQIFVTMHNYGVVSIWYSDDAGTTWLNKEGNLPDLPVKTILKNPLTLNEVIIGTDLGVWKTSNFNEASPTWSQSYNGMSNVPVLDLDLRDDNTVFAATYGRGVFSGKFLLDPNGDEDGDSILNGVDNCPTTANTDQKDTDGDGIGDVCQDTDSDGVVDTIDNCPTTANSDQKDTDGNGIGDVCQDTDKDGILDTIDNCPTTANTDQADTNGNGTGDICDTSYTAQDNISIQTISETCVDENDGKITINVKETFVSYTVTLKGDGKDETKKMTTPSVSFEDLKPEMYEVCITVDGKTYKQCFEINILAANPVSLKVAKNSESKDYTVNVNSGTAPYDVYLNGNLINSFNTSNFDVKVKGSGILEVKTAKPCEGVFKTTINNIFLKRNPVLNSIDLMLPITNTSNIDIIVFDITGKLVLQKTMQRQGNSLSIPFNNFKAGIYILKVGGADKNNTFKIIKK